ncbi:hypothetical protein CVT26_012675 [Gymnopilus dilepis]|uniref:F-box domain-containing protein n=1 Tax=Gymnopilus dilepis TaxID=231916 RepID=A0A409WAQ0_9AGAR|nr:hypothetical protein CVT26_012675 [Gymnopilus dilepis]
MAQKPSASQCSGRTKATYDKQGLLPRLAVDVLINILNFLRPCDIIGVRRTCKLLQEITKLRTVWVNALGALMEQHSISEAMFPLREMRVDILEHVALSPHRLVSLVKRSSAIEPSSIRTLSRDLSKEEKDTFAMQGVGQVNDLILACGGRYLVSNSVNSSRWSVSTLMSVWDLGICANDTALVLTRYLEQKIDLELRLFFPDPDVSGTFYVVSVQRSSAITVLIHRVLLSDSPSITSFSALELPVTAPTSPCLVELVPNSSRIVISSQHDEKVSLWIWDFLLNTGARLMGPECSLFPYRDTIMFASKDKVSIFNVPSTLHSYVPGQEAISKYEPSLVVTVPSKVSESYYIDYPNATPTPPKSTVVHYLLRLHPHQLTLLEITDIFGRDSLIPKQLPIKKKILDARDVRAFTALHRRDIDGCEGCLSLSGVDSDGTSICMLNVVASPGAGKDPKIGFIKASLNHLVNIDLVIQEFCTFLGRECVLTAGGDVVIFDYLLPR